ncbi:hypothetical protein JVU11DRAFT_11443 [Chiua virens]|nr:hypothetical protein JVU11DRAFT_11443 [Chiua virens]
MAPTLIRPYNFKLGEASTSGLAREPETMHIQSAVFSRSTGTVDASSGNSGSGLAENTIIFIVVGVVCLLVVVIGFYLVSRHSRAVCYAASNIPGSHTQHSPRSPITHPPHPLREHTKGGCWKIWKTWRHASDTDLPTTAEVPILQVTPAPEMIAVPPRIVPARSGTSKTYPPIASRPSQSRRVTSLSVTTSFSHSHITEEALNECRLSAYDLDGDLETEMLNSATDDAWMGHALVVEEACRNVGMEEVLETRGSLTLVDGSVEDCASPEPAAHWKGGDYGNSDAFESVASSSHGVEGEVLTSIR